MTARRARNQHDSQAETFALSTSHRSDRRLDNDRYSASPVPGKTTLCCLMRVNIMRVITTCEAINSIYTSLKYIVISENLTSLTELPHFGIVCQKLLFVLTLWIHLRIDWINFGKTKKFCIIGKLIFVPEVEVKSMLF